MCTQLPKLVSHVVNRPTPARSPHPTGVHRLHTPHPPAHGFQSARPAQCARAPTSRLTQQGFPTQPDPGPGGRPPAPLDLARRSLRTLEPRSPGEA